MYGDVVLGLQPVNKMTEIRLKLSLKKKKLKKELNLILNLLLNNLKELKQNQS
jgi:hypothetical protein